ncbi:putative polysaccharide biosynthesis protein [Longirhabdus pacifica]|uniref:putative polysaccharide biosynthesis protein n=1 Tax=Longirhabdus pacifica TaxID=2305227 RepID=UPI001008E039|nr:polysaccharide biosynthesis protein [Longirhabdus pacifica]
MKRKDSLIKGTIILAVAAFVARFLGIAQMVPLQNMMDDDGISWFKQAYNIYGILLMIATAGIPTAISKLISERNALRNIQESYKIFRAAVYFAIVSGILSAILLFFGAERYTQFSNNPDALWAVRAIAPALFIFPLIAILRGVFQGNQMMLPGALSQIVEQILRVFPAIIIASLLLYTYQVDMRWVAAGAAFGGVTGAVGAIGVMSYFYFKYRHQLFPPDKLKLRRQKPVMSYKDIYKTIFKTSIPITIVSILVPTIYFIDSTLTIRLLSDQLGLHKSEEMLGILTGRAQSLAGLPPILAIALSLSIVPIISTAYTQGKLDEVRDKAAQALRLSILSGMPLILWICISAFPLNTSLFTDADGSYVIILSTIAALFQIVMMTAAAILMGLGKTYLSVRFVVFGIIIKLLLSVLLSPFIGIYGIVLATLCCFLVVMWLNIHALKKIVHFQLLGARWKNFIAACSITAVIGFMILGLGYMFMDTSLHYRIDYFIHATLIGVCMSVTYVISLIVCRAITQDDMASFPAIAQKITRPLFRLAAR